MWIGWTCSPFLTSSDQHNAETLVLWVAKLKLSNNSLYCLTGCDDLSLNVSLSATRVRTQGCHQALRLLLKFENTFHHQGPTLKSHSRNPSAVDLLTTMTGRQYQDFAPPLGPTGLARALHHRETVLWPVEPAHFPIATPTLRGISWPHCTSLGIPSTPTLGARCVRFRLEFKLRSLMSTPHIEWNTRYSD